VKTTARAGNLLTRPRKRCSFDRVRMSPSPRLNARDLKEIFAAQDLPPPRCVRLRTSKPSTSIGVRLDPELNRASLLQQYSGSGGELQTSANGAPPPER
jgi:hypothetical protein